MKGRKAYCEEGKLRREEGVVKQCGAGDGDIGSGNFGYARRGATQPRSMETEYRQGMKSEQEEKEDG